MFKHYEIPLKVTDHIRATVRAKLWRMGKALSKLGSTQRQKKLANWKDGTNCTWNLKIDDNEVKQQLFKRKRSAEDQLQLEISKRKKLEGDIHKLEKSTKKVITQLTTGRKSKSSSKSWKNYSRQQQYNKRRNLANSIQHALRFCENEGFKPHVIELENIDTHACEVLDINTSTFIEKDKSTSPAVSTRSALHIKDKYLISNKAFHELSMVTNLPSSSKIKKLTSTLNSAYDILDIPNGIVGVQQSLRRRLRFHVTKLEERYREANKLLPRTIRVKLTGDGTQIARGFTVVNFAFTILEEETHGAASGNHSLAIFKVAENYDDLAAALQDIISEAKDLELLTIEEKVYNIQFFLGGDWKFLAIVCGLESATAEYACIWCKCPKRQRYDMDLTWSLLNSDKGGRTINEIANKSKLAKSNKNRFNCSREPLFPFIPMTQVVIDSLHLFLRISDVLINLLIRDIRKLDGVELCSEGNKKNKNIDVYADFLMKECKIRFRWFTDQESKKMTWRDLTGPEKVRLFHHIDIPTLFPNLQDKNQLQVLWRDFFALIETLGQRHCSSEEFGHRAKSWVKLFNSLYQTKDVTPYMHAFAMHVPEFLSLYGNINMFSQQGLEKLNDLTTIHFQHSTNHKESQALRQILQKRNRIEELEHFQRHKQIQTCTTCKQTGHNRRTCTFEK